MTRVWKYMGNVVAEAFLLAIIGCGGAQTDVRDADNTVVDIPRVSHSIDGVEIVEPTVLSPRSAEAAAALNARGDAVFVDGKIVFRGASAGLVISEMSKDGAKLLERSVVYLPDAVSDVVVEGGMAYVACGPRGVVVIDVTDPVAPRAISAVKTRGAALRLDFQGDRLLVADGSTGLLLLDVTDASSPVPMAAWKSEGYVRHAILRGDTVYVAEDLFGVTRLRITRDGFEMVWRYDTGGQARALSMTEQRLLVANGSSGIVMLDVSGQGDPVEEGRMSLDDMARDVLRLPDSGFGFVAAGDDGIIVVDVSDPKKMVKVGEFVPERPTNRMRAGEGDLLYVGNDADGMLILDVSTPKTPRRVFPPQ